MEILKAENINGNIYCASKSMLEKAKTMNEKIVFQDLKFDKRFAFLIGPKDSLEAIQKKMLKHVQSYFGVEEWNAYRQATKLFKEADVALQEERILPWLKEFIPLANNEFVRYALDFGELFQIFSKHHDFILGGNIDESSLFHIIIRSTLLDLSLSMPPSMYICELLNKNESTSVKRDG